MVKKNIQLEGKTILITGMAGFIGASIAKRMISDFENLKIVGVDSFNAYYDVSLKEYRIKEIYKLLEMKKYVDLSLIRGNIADNKIVSEIFQEYQPDVVVNLAAQAGVRYSIDHPREYMDSNVIGFFNILEACRHSYDNVNGGVRHLVYASSSSVYGANKKIPYSTDDKTDSPVSLYAATKKSNELLAHSYAKLYGIPSTGLRFFTVYGPAGRPDMAYFKFTDKLKENEIIEVYNYGKCERDFTYIDDVVESIIRVIQGAPKVTEGTDGLLCPPHFVYNIGAGHPVNLMEFVETLSDVLMSIGILPKHYELDSHIKLLPMQPGDVSVTYADIEPLESDYGYHPKTTLRDGLGKFAMWYRDYYLEHQ